MTDTGLPLHFLHPLQQLLQRGGPVVLVLLLMTTLANVILIGKTLQFHKLGIGQRSELYTSLREWRKGHWQQSFDT